MTDLEKEILNIINTTINGEYIAKLRVIHEDDTYELRLYMNQEMSPIILSYEGGEDAFKAFIAREMKERKMERISYWAAVQELPAITQDGDKEWSLDYDIPLIT